MRVVVSLTSIPPRLPNVHKVLQSVIDNQSVEPDIVYLNLPKVFKRTGEISDPSLLQYSHPKLKIVECEDYGPITKILPGLEIEQGNKETVLIIVDDDILYHGDFIEKFIDMARKHPGCAIIRGFGDRQYPLSPVPINDGQGPTIPYNFMGTLLPVGHMDFEDFKNFVMLAIADSECFRSDDYVLGAYLASRRIPRVLLNDHFPIFTPDHTSGNSLTAIQNGNPPTRYIMCYKYLRDLMSK
jgi:hypothetical protein